MNIIGIHFLWELYDYSCFSIASFDGDIAMPLMVNPKTNTSYILLSSQPQSGDRKKRGATADPSKLWPNGIVHYAFHSSIEGKYCVILYGTEMLFENI